MQKRESWPGTRTRALPVCICNRRAQATAHTKSHFHSHYEHGASDEIDSIRLAAVGKGANARKGRVERQRLINRRR